MGIEHVGSDPDRGGAAPGRARSPEEAMAILSTVAYRHASPHGSTAPPSAGAVWHATSLAPELGTGRWPGGSIR
jgi:hypothetical protein